MKLLIISIRCCRTNPSISTYSAPCCTWCTQILVMFSHITTQPEPVHRCMPIGKGEARRLSLFNVSHSRILCEGTFSWNQDFKGGKGEATEKDTPEATLTCQVNERNIIHIDKAVRTTNINFSACPLYSPFSAQPPAWHFERYVLSNMRSCYACLEFVLLHLSSLVSHNTLLPPLLSHTNLSFLTAPRTTTSVLTRPRSPFFAVALPSQECFPFFRTWLYP